jgi:MEKHLA domain
MNPDCPSEWDIAHAQCLVRSYARLTGGQLIAEAVDGVGLVQALYAASFVVVSHGTEADPVLNYGNATALSLWEMTWPEFTQTPSRFTAEAPNREERARLLAAVTAHGFIDDYTGVRISKNGRRFQITQATVWNLFAEDGCPCGQAATFKDWTWH